MTKEDLKEIHADVKTISREFNKFSGRIEAKLEHLATTADLTKQIGKAISGHIQSYHTRSGATSMMPRAKTNGRTIAALSGAVVTLGVVIALLVKLFEKFI